MKETAELPRGGGHGGQTGDGGQSGRQDPGSHRRGLGPTAGQCGHEK